MFKALYHLEQIIVNQKYWRDIQSRLTPIHLRLYYGILWILRIFNLMDEAALIPPRMRSPLADLRRMIETDDLPIVGPLVPYFRAVSIVTTPYPYFGDIVPVLPETPGATTVRDHAVDPSLRCYIPNIIALRRGVNRQRNRVHNDSQVYDYNFGSTALGAAAAQPAHDAGSIIVRFARISPGTVYPDPSSQYSRNFYSNSPSFIKVPNLAAAAGNQQWVPFLGFAINPQWFFAVASVARTIAANFRNSTTLGELALRGNNAALILTIGGPDYPNQDDHLNESTYAEIPLSAAFETAAETIDPPHDAYGLLSAVNYVPPVNYANNAAAGTYGEHGNRYGPWWAYHDTLNVKRITWPISMPWTTLPDAVEKLHVGRPPRDTR
jgi:hypothetical protein